MVTMYAHEIAEVVTDYVGAWYFDTSPFFESGDVCVWDFGALPPAANSNVVVGQKSFLVQKMWVPTEGCRLSL
jgi:hypothetical protein